jgi:LmbE family N-acetylglucosaminyl deacetylase
MMRRVFGLGLALGVFSGLVSACDLLEPKASPSLEDAPPRAAVPAPPPEPVCHNAEIPASSILVVAPHPDDETLGFAGPIHAAAQAGRRVRVVITTDGQAYCGACQVWKNGVPRGGERAEPCTVRELIVFGHVRRRESLAAMELLGVDARDVTFLGYVDGSLQEAWHRPELPPAVPLCIDDGEPHDEWRDKTGARLTADLARVLREEEDAHAVFTTDPRDTHPDHATLHAFVTRAIVDEGGGRELFTALIHRSVPGSCRETDRGRGCTLPQPSPRDAEGQGFRELRELSYAPTTFWDAREEDFGAPLRFCLPPPLYEGSQPLKRRAIERYETQIGVRDRFGAPLPDAYQGWVDWSGWLLGFVRRDELLYRSPLPADAASVSASVAPPPS